jgi:hypothetical protein
MDDIMMSETIMTDILTTDYDADNTIMTMPGNAIITDILRTDYTTDCMTTIAESITQCALISTDKHFASISSSFNTTISLPLEEDTSHEAIEGESECC